MIVAACQVQWEKDKDRHVSHRRLGLDEGLVEEFPPVEPHATAADHLKSRGRLEVAPKDATAGKEEWTGNSKSGSLNRETQRNQLIAALIAGRRVLNQRTLARSNPGNEPENEAPRIVWDSHQKLPFGELCSSHWESGTINGLLTDVHALNGHYFCLSALPVRTDGQTGVLMVFPPVQTFTGTKACTSMSGHEYPRQPWLHLQKYEVLCSNCVLLIMSGSGITTFEEIILGAGEAFNIDPKMGLGRLSTKAHAGNPFVNKVSIGGVSPLVPPLPGQIDGTVTQGNSKTRTGDGSLTRSDVHIGDNRNFNQTLWDQDLEQLAALGDDGPDGPATVFNLQTLVGMARHNLETDQVLDLERTGTARRLRFWAHPSPLRLWQHCPSGFLAITMKTEFFVADPKPPAPFNISQGCGNYWDVLVHAVPASLANVTGIFKQNVDLLTGILFNASGRNSGNPPWSKKDTVPPPVFRIPLYSLAALMQTQYLGTAARSGGSRCTCGSKNTGGRASVIYAHDCYRTNDPVNLRHPFVEHTRDVDHISSLPNYSTKIMRRCRPSSVVETSADPPLKLAAEPTARSMENKLERVEL
ncbi:hypothetical protein B0H14DRAFT_3139328 [Mycena olivaceomarginata]|nr:hypothetical protein B0H14DRAFT_3139328 [Mycena olivaceomarginata]